MKYLIFMLLSCAGAAASAQETVSYTYDALGRLRQSSASGGPNSGTQTSIDYDSAGNRSSYRIAGASGAPRTGLKIVAVPLNGFTIIAIPNPWAAK